MAVLVLFSTVSFTVEKHYCGDVLIDAAVFTEVQKCKMETSEVDVAKITKKSCCKDELEVVKGQDQLKLSKFEELSVNQLFILTAFIYTFNEFYESLPKTIIPHKDYSPPNLTEDILVLDQVFLI